jgi:peptidoglycan hydrolase-like protein with peptidoglycan-binding domain
MARRKKKRTMTATTLTHLPLAAGGAIAHSAGRAALWVVAQYMRAPLSNTAIAALVSISLLAGSNALYWQHGEHPAPLFGVTAPAAGPAHTQSIPVLPAVRVPDASPSVAAPTRQTTGSVPAATTSSERPIGNAEVFELQRKLQSLGLYDDRIDGFYGPNTARAIRAFEARQGLRERGELNRDIVRQILSTSAVAPAPAAASVATPQPVREAVPVARSEPAPIALPLVAPQQARAASVAPANPVNAVIAPQPVLAAPMPPASVPLASTVSPLTVGSFEPAPAPRQPLRREMPATPQDAMNLAVETAGDAIDTIIQGVQSVAMTPPPAAQPMPERQPMPQRPQPQAVAAAQPATIAPRATVTAASLPQPPTAASAPALSIGAAAFSPHDREVVAKIQRGLGSLGFLHGPADGVAGEATARAIRNFEVYYNYDVTGRISPELIDLLVDKGAVI